jgi:hypothetical protein
MNTAWSATLAVCSPLQSLLRWLIPGPQALPIHAVQMRRPAACPQTAAMAHRVAPRPLRVVRVMEAGQPRSQVGRMVISGRMADVCAELDRLAACEAARS